MTPKTKTCEACGKIFPRRLPDGTLIRSTAWMVRRFCEPLCYRKSLLAMARKCRKRKGA